MRIIRLLAECERQARLLDRFSEVDGLEVNVADGNVVVRDESFH